MTPKRIAIGLSREEGELQAVCAEPTLLFLKVVSSIGRTGTYITCGTHSHECGKTHLCQEMDSKRWHFSQGSLKVKILYMS